MGNPRTDTEFREEMKSVFQVNRLVYLYQVPRCWLQICRHASEARTSRTGFINFEEDGLGMAGRIKRKVGPGLSSNHVETE